MRLIVCCFDSLYRAEEARISLVGTDPEIFEEAVVAVRKPDGVLKWTTWNYPAFFIPLEKIVGNTKQSIPQMILQCSEICGPSSDADDSDEYQLHATALMANSEGIAAMGISTEFLKELSDHLKPGCSALFISSETAASTQLLQLLQDMSAKILKTEVDYDEQRYRELYMARMNSWLDSNLKKKLAEADLDASIKEDDGTLVKHHLRLPSWLERLFGQ